MRLAAAIIALAAAFPLGAGAASSDLWRVVHDLCVTDKAVLGLAAPCLAVERREGYAVIADPGHRTQVLLVPTRRIRGIESPRLLSPGAPNYWRLAWRARSWFEHRAGRVVSPEDVAIAVNSAHGRAQDQLHFHIDCVRTRVKNYLASARIGSDWAPLKVRFAGHRYRARRLEAGALATHDPFRLLAEGGLAEGSTMADYTLVMVAVADPAPGFVLLAARGGTAEDVDGAGEELLDHDCQVLRNPTPPDPASGRPARERARAPQGAAGRGRPA